MGRVVFEQTVHTFQIDINRHVSNIVYVQWLEIGRTRLLEAIGRPIESMQARGFFAILVETWIKYLEPIHYPDTVRVEVWVSDLTRVSAWMEFQMTSTKTGRVVTRARQRGVFVDAETNRPYRLTPEDRAAFESVLEVE